MRAEHEREQIKKEMRIEESKAEHKQHQQTEKLKIGKHMREKLKKITDKS